MELKYIKFNKVVAKNNLFKLYLYGIEITKTDPTAFVPAGSNCTFMELK